MSKKGTDFSEENYDRSQKNEVYKTLICEPMTMLEVANQLNIFRANICRHIDELRRKGLAVCIRKRRCTISGNAYVGEYSTDPSLFPEDNQLNFIFDND